MTAPGVGPLARPDREEGAVPPGRPDPPDHADDEPPPFRVGRELGVLVLTALVIAVVVKTFVAQAYYIPSGSMLPQLQIDDRIVVSKLAYKLHDPRRGDILVFDAPGGRPKDTSPLPERAVRGVVQAIGLSAPSTDEYIKRVVGLPGERVEAHGGRVYVDGRAMVEPYLPAGVTTADFATVVVPPHDLWVMGDNRDDSADSRVFGPIPENTVVGRAFVRVWPFDHTSFL